MVGESCSMGVLERRGVTVAKKPFLLSEGGKG